MRLSIVLLCLFSFAGCCSDDKTLFSFNEFPEGDNLKHKKAYFESESDWSTELDEKKVFHHQINWGEKKSGWQIRIGKGGQIYSFRGPFGEAMPPQIHKGSEWNDEVWQLVSVCSKKNNARIEKVGKRIKRTFPYYIHGSGVYKRDSALKQTFYNPILAEYTSPSSYAILNWGQHAHIPTIHRSAALYYTHINAMPDGTVEINYTIHNFGRDILDYFNTPWGGVRESTLPVHILSKPDGSYGPTDFASFGNKSIKNINETGAWSGFFTDDSPEAWGIAIVFGNSEELFRTAKVRYRWGYAGGRKKNDRDYFVSVVNPRIPLEEGKTLRVKIFVIVDQLKNIRRRVEKFKDKVEYKVTQFEKSPKVKTSVKAKNFSGGIELSKWPIKGTKPLFLVKHVKDKQLYITDDLYRFSSRNKSNENDSSHKSKDLIIRPYDGNTEYLKLLGFVDKNFEVKY